MSEGMAERESPGEAGLGRTMYLKTRWTKRSRLFGSKETPLRGRHSDYLQAGLPTPYTVHTRGAARVRTCAHMLLRLWPTGPSHRD